MNKIIFVLILFSITPIVSSQNDKIEITFERKSDNSIDFYYSKNLPGSYSLRLEFTTLENSLDKRIYKKVLKYDSGSLFTIQPNDPKKGISFGYRITYTIGNPKPKIKKSITYSLPFIANKSVKIMEASYLGETYFESEKPIDWKSFVFYSDKSDTVCSMRKGKVIKIVDKYNYDSAYKKVSTSKRNAITIEHDDGTYSIYNGFAKNEIFVKLGQDVYPQTVLGKLELFNKGKYRLDFSVYHYLENLLDERENETLKNRKFRTKFLNPYFLTDKGLNQIESGQNYKTTFNDAILLQELSRKEKKKYKKNSKFYLEKE